MAKRNIYFKIVLLTFLVLLSSCEQERLFPEGPINSFGNVNRSNYYSTISTFLSGGLSVEQIYNYSNDTTDGFLGNPLPISSSKTILSTKSGKIIQTTFATVDWEYTITKSGFVIAPMGVDKSGNIYAITSNKTLVSLQKDGTYRFEHPLITPKRYESFHPVTCTENGVLIQSSHGYQCIIQFDGRMLWENNQSSVRTPFPATIENGSFASYSVPINDSISPFIGIYSLQSGTSSTVIPVNKSFEIVTSPLLNGNSLTVLGKEEEKTICKRITFTNEIIWKNDELPMFPKGISISDSGNIIISAYEPGVAEYRSCVVSLSSNGELKWKKYFDHRIISPVMLSQNDMVFLGTSQYSNGLYFLTNAGNFKGSVVIPQEIIAHLKIGITPSGAVTLGTQKTLRILRSRQ
jgi:hypothetical protein